MPSSTSVSRRPLAALADAVFAVAMTVGWLTVDSIAGRFGPAFVVRYGSLTAAMGILLVMLSPAFGLVGWAIFGVGLAGVVPQHRSGMEPPHLPTGAGPAHRATPRRRGSTTRRAGLSIGVTSPPADISQTLATP